MQFASHVIFLYFYYFLWAVLVLKKNLNGRGLLNLLLRLLICVVFHVALFYIILSLYYKVNKNVELTGRLNLLI